MKLKKLILKNFRNFDDCEIELTNKNLIFGMNDVGKSNMIYALRLLFEQRIRNTPIQQTDFHKQNTQNNFEISCLIDLSGDDVYSQLLIAKAESASVDDKKLFKISLSARYCNGEPEVDLHWGTETEELIEIPKKGVNRSLLDDVFHCVYIPAQNNLNTSFKEFKKELLANHEQLETDLESQKKISKANEVINNEVAKLSSVNNMEVGINNMLSLFDKDYLVKISSNHTFGDLHNNLDLYMHDNNNSDHPEIYPTSGDGRIRKVMYALISYLLQEGRYSGRKIPLLLIEEPENHLFLSAQVELSKTIFREDFSPYLFLTTHSPQLFFKISDQANLIRLQKKDGSICTKSQIAYVPSEYNTYKNILLENLARCLFVDKVLLVEGESEKLLFECILDRLGKNRQNILIQPVLGVHFDLYVRILTGLGIKVLVKTDNDIKKNRASNDNPPATYSAIGYNRCVKLFNMMMQETQQVEKLPANEREPNEFRNHIITNFSDSFSKFNAQGIFLSERDLENDLASCLKLDSPKEFVNWLQKAKWHNMWFFTSLDENEIPKQIYSDLSTTEFEELAKRIYKSDLFKCLRVLTDD